MARITLAEAQGWLESTKLTIASLDASLLGQLEEEILSRLSVVYDTSAWTSDTTTPKLIRTIIAKTYASWLYNRQYSEDQGENNEYALKLLENAEMLMNALIGGQIEIPGGPEPETSRGASFYPTDASSVQEPTDADPSLGGPYFSLGRLF